MSKKDKNIIENEQSVKAAAEEVVDRVSSVKEATEEEHMALDDARRVKVLSPSMLVFKRFIRNKLAITGSIILIFMFLFSFVGGWLSPYTETQVFNTTTIRPKSYALGTETKNTRFIDVEGESLGNDRAAVLFALKEKLHYTDGNYTSPVGTVYKVDFFTDNFANIYRMTNVANIITMAGAEPTVEITAEGQKYYNLSAADNSALLAAAEKIGTAEGITLKNGNKNCLFQYKDEEMLAVRDSKTKANIYAPVLVTMSSRSQYDACTPAEQATIDSYAFQFAYETAVANDQTSFEVDGVTYEIDTDSMAVITQEITNINDPNFDPNFSATIEANGFHDAIEDLVLNSEDTETKKVTVGDREYTLEWVEYEAEAYTGRAGNAEMDAIVAAPGFKEAAYDCYLANIDTINEKQAGGVYGKYPFTANGADYTLEYSEEAGHYIIKEAGKDIYYAKLVFVNAYDVSYIDENGDKIIYAQASKWSANSVKKNGEPYAYVSNFKVIPDASRGGLVLDLDFMNKVRKACAAMPTAAQSGTKFNHKIYVVDVLEPMMSSGKLCRDTDDSEEIDPEQYSYGIIELAVVDENNNSTFKYFAITEDGTVVELATSVKRSPTEIEDDFGKYYVDADTEAHIYKVWPLLVSDNDGQYYEDQNGAKVYVNSEITYKPVTIVEVEDEAEVKYYRDLDGNNHLASEVKPQQTEDGTGYFFINEDGDQVDLEVEAVYSAVSESDDQGSYYTTSAGEKVYIVNLAVNETEDGYTVTDAFGGEHKIMYASEIVVNKQNDDGGEYVTGVNGEKLYVNDIGIHTEEGSDSSRVDDDKMFVWLMDTNNSTADNMKTEKVYIKTTTSQNIANEGDEGAYLKDMEFEVQYGNMAYTVVTNTEIEIFDTNGAPSRAHWLGTDNHGMDTLTRIMYGGRISLMVGFVVIFIEMFIGVIFGGISGYFGGVVDTIMMRFVDLFNCIPYWPMMLIGGSLMDAYGVRGVIRIFVLVGIMGILGWTGTARIVRGQILSLREQDFMVATEAGGIRVSRRIFKHLVPNVMPLLIVQATMGLGSIIISEATLSFLGLGVQFPQASWGSIINSVQTAFEMTNYWYVWVPTGLCIMLAVLGFNFVGDGLRDAFDPKMKR